MQRKKKILVTGANGYIGRHVVDALISKGADVIAADLATDHLNPLAQKFQCDVLDLQKNVYDFFEEPDACVHLAWKDSFAHNSEKHMADLSKHYKFIQQLVSSGLKQLAVMGSMHEVGYYEGCVSETTICNPMNLYGVAKDALRRSAFIVGHQHQVVVQWLRAFYIYGDDKTNHSIFTKLIEAEENGRKIFPFTTGQNKNDFIHIDSLADMISASLMQKEIQGIIHCCTGKAISLSEMVEQFIIDHKFSIKLAYGAFPERPYDSPAIWGDSSKINQILASGKFSSKF